MAHKGAPQRHFPLRSSSITRAVLEAAIENPGMKWSVWAKERGYKYRTVAGAVHKLRLRGYLKDPEGGNLYGCIYPSEKGRELLR